MICLIEAPLADDKVGTGVLDPLDHISELFLFILLQLLAFFCTRDVEFMFRLWSWGLEGASEDRETSVMNGVRHLRMGYVIVDEHTLNEGGVCKWPSTVPSTLIISEDTPFRSRSATVKMASIVIRANFSCSFEVLQM